MPSRWLLTFVGITASVMIAHASPPRTLGHLPAKVVSLAGGWWFGCAALEDGSVWAWGDNEDLAFGASGPPSGKAVRVAGLTNVVQVAAGRNHACAIRRDGSLWCWGDNGSGKAGNLQAPYGKIAPTRIALAGRVVAVAPGEYHSVALLADGSVWAWGRNSSGELGFGKVPPSPEGAPPSPVSTEPLASVGADSVAPTRVTGLPGPATGIAAFGGRSAAVVDGQVWWWGAGAFRIERFGGSGGLHPPPLSADELPPRKVEGLPRVRKLVFTREGGLALADSGQLWRWIAPPPWSGMPLPPPPAPEPGLEGLVDVVTGGMFACVRRADRAVLCFGGDPSWPGAGIRGDGTVGRAGPPVPVPGILGSVVGAGLQFACVGGETPDGVFGLWSWGVVHAPSDHEAYPATTAVATPIQF